MSTEIQRMLDALSEETIARKVNEAHDDARARYALESNSVRDYDEYTRIIGDYYNYHFSTVFTGGARVSETKALAEAKKLIGNAYRHEGKDPNLAYVNAEKRLDGGLRRILDIIAEQLKFQDETDYVNGIFDQYVKPNSYDQKVEIIRQFMEHCHAMLGGDVDTKRPERYVSDYKELIQSYLRSMRAIGQHFRSL